jgi:hypothetical protein
MNLRARRVTIGAAALGVVLIAVLVVANWGTVSDHVEAWHFQLMTETQTFESEPGMTKAVVGDWVPGQGMNDRALFGYLAHLSGIPVVLNPAAQTRHFHYREEYPHLTSDTAIGHLEKGGYRVLYQHFPRRAYVVIPDSERVVIRNFEHMEEWPPSYHDAYSTTMTGTPR